MRRFVITLSAVAALVLLPAHAAWGESSDLTPGVSPEEQSVASSSSQEPFAVGGGSLAGRETSFAFSARLAKKGESASGHAVIRDPVDGDAQGHLCPAIEIDTLGTLRFWIEVDHGSGTLGLFPFLEITATDGVPDSLAVRGASACTFPGTFGFDAPVGRGTILIKP